MRPEALESACIATRIAGRIAGRIAAGLLLAAIAGTAVAQHGEHATPAPTAAGSGHSAHASAPAPAATIELPAPGYGELGFAPPEPGSYKLGSLGLAGDGDVLDVSGKGHRLHTFMGDRITVLSFIYGSCHDVNGCPLANAVLRRIQKRLRAHQALSDELRLITLSFDPTRDTPSVMERHGEILTGGHRSPEWVFLTTESDAEVAPILKEYGQSIVREPTPEGSEAAAPISHNLKVFLIDRTRQVRNVYGVSFLHPDTLVADIRTLLLEEQPQHVHAVGMGMGHTPDDERRLGPGDVREGYESTAYQTRSRALQNRGGKTLDLLQHARQSSLGLPPLEILDASELTETRIELGRKLFFDRRLSSNGTFSCAMCHIPEQGFTSNELATPIGLEGRTIRRNAPSLLNVAYRAKLFHDAREDTLENQIWAPLLARNEMANESEAAVLARVAELDRYADAFEDAFPGRGLGRDTLGIALASYQRTLIAGNSPFDRWKFGDDAKALPVEAIRGFEIFRGKAGCTGCHGVGETTAGFTDDDVHNTGIGVIELDRSSDTQTVQVSPGVEVEVPRDIIAAVSEPKPDDLGRFEITGIESDRWKYKTPTLRNVALTAPYMHDGSLRSLEAVIEFYDRGGAPNPGLDPRVRPLGLSADEKHALLSFLESLTSSDLEALVRDAFAAPVGDVSASESHPNIR